MVDRCLIHILLFHILLPTSRLPLLGVRVRHRRGNERTTWIRNLPSNVDQAEREEGRHGRPQRAAFEADRRLEGLHQQAKHESLEGVGGACRGTQRLKPVGKWR